MVKGTKSSDDCICEKGSYARNASVICQSCGALKWTDERGATSAQQCSFTAALSVIIALPLALLVVAIFVLLVFRYFRAVLRDIDKEQRRSKILACASQADNLAFQMKWYEKILKASTADMWRVQMRWPRAAPPVWRKQIRTLSSEQPSHVQCISSGW